MTSKPTSRNILLNNSHSTRPIPKRVPQVAVNLTAKEKQMLKKKAEAKGLKMGVFIKMLLKENEII